MFGRKPDFLFSKTVLLRRKTQPSINFSLIDVEKTRELCPGMGSWLSLYSVFSENEVKLDFLRLGKWVGT